MAQYLKSLATGCVLPYVEASLKCADVRKMTADECEEYEASLNKPVKAAPKVVEPEPEPDVEPEVVVPEIGETVIEDFDPDVEWVLGALEVD